MKINYLSFFVGALLIANSAFSQVGINTNDPKAQLDVEAADAVSPQPSDGLLVPRVQTLPAAGADQHSMIIYLTNTIGTFTPGFYYWDESVSNWISFGGGAAVTTGDYWDLEGNAGTNSVTDFIGTIDNEDLVIRTNNQPRLKISTKSQLEILNSGNSVFLGENAGTNDDLSSNQNTFIGAFSGAQNIVGSNNIAIGYRSLLSNQIGENNTIIGSNAFVAAGFSFTGIPVPVNNNIIIGSSAGTPSGFFGNSIPTSNVLIIEPSGTSSPLIGGNFSTNRVGVNRDINNLTHTLTVGGNVFAQSGFFTGAGGSYPDYVFQKYFEGESSILPEYEFKSLEEVEQFIKNHGHLPGVKSYKEVEENNFNIELSATSIKNLEKIEELFLYSIELNSKVKSQAKELQEKDSQIDDLEQRIERLEKLILEKNK